MHNMMGLIPRCAAVMAVDNSTECGDDGLPQPRRLFSLAGDHFNYLPIKPMPGWARPLADIATKRVHGRSRMDT